MNPLHRLTEYGQSLWLDDISRGLIKRGELRRLIEEDRLTGLTSNPALFSKAISQSTHYDDALDRVLQVNPRAVSRILAERMVVEDIQLAAAVLRPVYDRTAAADGFVSVAVSPAYAHDTAATVADARRLWFEIARPNVMIEVAATPEAVPAVELLIAQGINVNVTLVFSLEQYEAFAHAYIRGVARHAEPRYVSSVASVFVSPLDSLVDGRLTAIGSAEALALRGQMAIANARRLYRRFGEIFRGQAFANQARRGARVQRPLWASTGTKNPSYADVLYLEGLIGRDTVTAVPPATLDAFRDHGRLRSTLEQDPSQGDVAMAAAAAHGLDIAALAEQLQAEGLAASTEAYEQLLVAIEQKRRLITTALR